MIKYLLLSLISILYLQPLFAWNASGRHWTGCEVEWTYLHEGELYDVDTLIELAVDGSRGWNGANIGIRFVKNPLAYNYWKWDSLPSWVAGGCAYYPNGTDTVLEIDSMYALLNKYCAYGWDFRVD